MRQMTQELLDKVDRTLQEWEQFKRANPQWFGRLHFTPTDEALIEAGVAKERERCIALATLEFERAKSVNSFEAISCASRIKARIRSGEVPDPLKGGLSDAE